MNQIIQKLKKWDKVLFSSCPAMGIPYEEYICRTDEIENKNAWCNTVFLEWYSWWVDAEFCKKI